MTWNFSKYILLIIIENLKILFNMKSNQNAIVLKSVHCNFKIRFCMKSNMTKLLLDLARKIMIYGAFIYFNFWPLILHILIFQHKNKDESMFLLGPLRDLSLTIRGYLNLYKPNLKWAWKTCLDKKLVCGLFRFLTKKYFIENIRLLP